MLMSYKIEEFYSIQDAVNVLSTNCSVFLSFLLRFFEEVVLLLRLYFKCESNNFRILRTLRYLNS